MARAGLLAPAAQAEAALLTPHGGAEVLGALRSALDFESLPRASFPPWALWPGCLPAMSKKSVNFETDQRGVAQQLAEGQKKLFSETESVDEIWKVALKEPAAGPPAAAPANDKHAAPDSMEDAVQTAVKGMARDMVAAHFTPHLEHVRQQLADAESQKEALRKKLEEALADAESQKEAMRKKLEEALADAESQKEAMRKKKLEEAEHADTTAAASALDASAQRTDAGKGRAEAMIATAEVEEIMKEAETAKAAAEAAKTEAKDLSNELKALKAQHNAAASADSSARAGSSAAADAAKTIQERAPRLGISTSKSAPASLLLTRAGSAVVQWWKRCASPCLQATAASKRPRNFMSTPMSRRRMARCTSFMRGSPSSSGRLA